MNINFQGNLIPYPNLSVTDPEKYLGKQVQKLYAWIRGDTPPPYLPKALFHPLKIPLINFVFDPILLPTEVVEQIFSGLEKRDLKNILSLNSQVMQLLKKDYFAREIYLADFSFNPNDWNTVFGEETLSENEIEKAFKNLPSNLYQILKTKCPLFGGKFLGNSHALIYIPEKIKEKTFTIEGFIELLRSKNIDLNCDLNDYLLVKKIESGWMMITKNVLPKSSKRDYEEQEELVKSLFDTYLIKYEIPRVLEILIANHVYYFKKGSALFEKEKPTGYKNKNTLYPEGIDCLLEAHYREKVGVLAAFRFGNI